MYPVLLTNTTNFPDFSIVDGLIVVVIGFALVFLVLCVISFVLSIFSLINKITTKKKTDAPQIVEQKPVETVVTQVKEEDNLELIAVITAAIAASMNTTTDKIVVRSIRKTSNWNKSAIRKNQKSF